MSQQKKLLWEVVMKIQNNVNAISTGKETENQLRASEKANKAKNNKKNGITVKANDLNLVPQKDESIKQLLGLKAEMAKKNEQMDVQAKLDAIRENRTEKIKGHQKDIKENLDLKNQLLDKEDDLTELYGVEEGSQEANELALRRKFRDMSRGGDALTEEEFEAFQALEEPSEYQHRMLETDDMIINFEDVIDASQKELKQALGEERAAEISQEDTKILKQYKEIIEEEMKNIDKQINEKVIESVGNVVDEKL